MTLPPNSPFSAPQQELLQNLLPQLSRDQSLWLSGYLAAAVNHAAAPSLASPAAAVAAPPAASAPVTGVPLTILFATESGNSEALADQTVALAKRKGFKAKAKSVADVPVSELPKLENVLLIASTWGDGEPPDPAVDFHKELQSESAPSLKKVHFSVCALGDTSYDQFCQFGKELDQRFADLGATRVSDRVDCDIDFEESWETWANAALSALTEANQQANPVSTNTVAAQPAETAAPVASFESAYGKKNPFPAEVLEKVNLNGTGSAKETIHLELSLASSGLSYEAGDALALIPTNREHDVSRILEATGLSATTEVTTKTGTGTLENALRHELDITALSKRVVEKYNAIAESEKLAALLNDKAELNNYLWGRQIVDLFREFPVKGLNAEQFVGLLRKLPPRLYSIASSIAMHPEEVHLTIGAVRYNSHNLDRTGVASTHVADVLEPGTTVPVFIQPNKNFKLPVNDNTPVIMVGPGTGIAPFRSFIEERAANKSPGKNWLFFGDQKSQFDFLYQLEWQQYAKDGILSRIDTAFSRDQEEKIYVQHRLLEHAEEIWNWLEQGAHFYVCGDASRMASDVHQALIECVMKGGRLKADSAEAYLDELKKKRRYQRDVY